MTATGQLWFVTGSQLLYGKKTLDAVSEHVTEMVNFFNESGGLPTQIINKGVMKTSEEITATLCEANADPRCAGVITWCHTFSPSKMWIAGLSRLQKPHCHLHTQYNRNIPDKEIDMAFMNLNQAAHGDREHGFLAARLRTPRKIIVGFWQDADVLAQLSSFCRSALGVQESRSLKVVRFGDNMRQVAVTEGDKVEVQRKLGFEVNTIPVGDLVEVLNQVTEAEIDQQMAYYEERYEMNPDDLAAIRVQAQEQIAMRKVLEQEGAHAYTNTFEDLHGMRQLPGLASQSLMEEGYGYGGEGDWKVSALTRIMKVMATGLPGGTSFMEDYTYDLQPGEELSLGAHMLEVCPSIAAERPKIEVHPLGIGGKEPPARLVFEGHAGSAICASLVDMGGRLRLIVQDIEAVKPIYEMPNLPVARVMWRGLPDFKTGCHCWLLAGGAHHTVLSYSVTAEMMRDFAEMMEIEFVHIGKDTTVEQFKQTLFLADLSWKLR